MVISRNGPRGIDEPLGIDGTRGIDGCSPSPSMTSFEAGVEEKVNWGGERG